MIEDLEGRLARGSTARFKLADVERVPDDRVVCRVDNKLGQGWGLARQDGGDGGIDVEPGGAEGGDGFDAVFDGFAARLEDLANSIVVRGDRDADAQVCVFGHGLKEADVAQDIGGAGLDDEDLRRVHEDLLENERHQFLMHLSRLVGVGERRAVDPVIGLEFLFE